MKNILQYLVLITIVILFLCSLGIFGDIIRNVLGAIIGAIVMYCNVRDLRSKA